MGREKESIPFPGLRIYKCILVVAKNPCLACIPANSVLW